MDGMTAFLALETLLTGGMVFGCALNALTAPRAEGLPKPKGRPKVSLLIPARNEAVNLESLLPCLRDLEWDDLEIVILDDQSEDGTPAILEKELGRNPRLRLLSGSPLPPDWLGKNWACHQLYLAARGDILVFCDADARPASLAIARTVALFEKHGTGMASFIPRQILGSWAEKSVIPVLLHLFCCGYLPMRLIPLLKWRALGVANGQWLAFTRRAYLTLGGHAAVRNHVVEDLGLARLAQVTGVGLVLALAARTLEVRMYRDFRGVWEGFGKNLFILAAPQIWRWFPLLLLFLLAHVAPLATALWALGQGLHAGFSGMTWLALLPAALVLQARMLSGSLLREPADSLFWHPVGVLLIPVIVAQSRWNHARGTLAWKGRRLLTGSTPSEIYP